MTFNPNPSPELCALVQSFLISLTGGGRNAANTLSINHDELAKLVKDAERALSQTLPAPGEVDYAEMLQTAWESCPSGDGLGLPPIIFSDAEAAHIVKSLATVAAANDEGVARIEFIARVLWADGQRRLKQGQSDLPRTRTDFRDAARALLDHPALATSRSQHEGASS